MRALCWSTHTPAWTRTLIMKFLCAHLTGLVLHAHVDTRICLHARSCPYSHTSGSKHTRTTRSCGHPLAWSDTHTHTDTHARSHARSSICNQLSGMTHVHTRTSHAHGDSDVPACARGCAHVRTRNVLACGLCAPSVTRTMAVCCLQCGALRPGIILVLDNARIHFAEKIINFLNLFLRAAGVMMVRLPKYW